MRRILIAVMVVLTVVFITIVRASQAEEASSQTQPVTKKAKKQTAVKKSKENPEAKPTKTNDLHKPDERDIVTDYSTQAIRAQIIQYFQSGNVSPMVGDIIIDDNSPLTIQLSTATDGEMVFEHKSNSLNIAGKGTLTAKDMKYALVQKNGDKLPGSAKDNVWISAKDTAAAIKSGSIAFAGIFKTNDKSISFPNGSVVFKDLVKPGTFTEGSTLIYDDTSYSYISGSWKKTQ